MKNKKKFLIFFLFLFTTFVFAKNYRNEILNSFDNLKNTAVNYKNGIETTQNVLKSLDDFEYCIKQYSFSDVYKFDITQGVQKEKLISNIFESITKCRTLLNDNSQNDNQKLLVLKSEYAKICMYMVEFSQSEISFLTYSNKLFSATLIVLVILVILSIVLGILFINYKSKAEDNTKLLNTIIQVQENERNRISRDLHDTVTQDIRSVLFFIEELSKKQEQDNVSNEQKDLTNKISTVQTQNLSDIRSIIKNLTPPQIEHGDFKLFLREYCNQFTLNTKINCTFFEEDSISFSELSSEKKLHLFRIIQEALNNIQKHSNAQECSILFRKENKNLVLLISDDGKGFDINKINSIDFTSIDGTGFGIKGMKTRAQILNAFFQIKSNDIGTEIIVKVKI